jgi:hypothetical protein
MGAWVQVASSVARASRMVSVSVLRRFWPIVVVAAAALGGLLYLVTANLSGAKLDAQAWNVTWLPTLP